MVQRYSRTYTSEQAVLAHAGLSPVGQLETAGVESSAKDARASEPEPRGVAKPRPTCSRPCSCRMSRGSGQSQRNAVSTAGSSFTACGTTGAYAPCRSADGTTQ